MFSSASAVLQFGALGVLNPTYGAIFGSVSFVSSYLGVSAINMLVQRSGKSSVILLILALVIAVAAIVTAVFGGIAAARDFRRGTVGFEDYCRF